MIKRMCLILEKILPHSFYVNYVRPTFFPNEIIPVWKHMGGFKKIKTDYARISGKGDKEGYELLYRNGKIPLINAKHILAKNLGDAIFMFVTDPKKPRTWSTMDINDKEFKPIPRETLKAVRAEVQRAKDRARPSGFLSQIPLPMWIMGIIMAAAVFAFVVFKYGPSSLFEPRTVKFVLESADGIKEGTVGAMIAIRKKKR